jgi:hypothetical protein
LLAAAFLFGSLAWPLLVESGRENRISLGIGRVGELALVGLFLGLSALVAVSVLSTVGLLAAYVWPRAARFGWAASLLLATLIWIGLAANDELGRPFLADPTRPPSVVAAGAVVAALSIGRRAARARLGALGSVRRP